jgi:hypothetical protein
MRRTNQRSSGKRGMDLGRLNYYGNKSLRIEKI